MGHLSSRHSLGAGIVLGAVGFVASTVLMSGTAGAEPPSPPGPPLIQCTGFYGPNTTWPHYLTGCTSRTGSGTGQTNRTAPGTETITWDAPFEGGDSLQLTNIQSTVLGVTGNCPDGQDGHPVEVNVSGVIAPGEGQYSNSLVTATICSNATDFVLKPDTLFVIQKPGSAGNVNPLPTTTTPTSTP
jgi:hypothetical protein